MQKGDPVRYQSFAGLIYDAVVTAVGPEGFVSLAVNVGAKEPWPLAAVRVGRCSLPGAGTAQGPMSGPTEPKAHHGSPQGQGAPS
jgi:hypothetical protein